VQVIVLEDVNTAVFIDADFSGTSDGSIDAPLTDLALALTDTDDDADFYIQTPDNNAAYVLWTDPSFIPSIRDGKSIYGGYRDDWSRDTSTNHTPITAERFGLIFRSVDQMTTVSGLDLTVTQPTQDAMTFSPQYLSIRPTVGYVSNGVTFPPMQTFGTCVFTGTLSVVSCYKRSTNKITPSCH
jgi:hypothetical protein